MRWVLIPMLLVPLLASCSTVAKIDKFLNETEIEVADAQKVSIAMTEAIKAGDLNNDGKIKGLDEWAAVVRKFVESL